MALLYECHCVSFVYIHFTFVSLEIAFWLMFYCNIYLTLNKCYFFAYLGVTFMGYFCLIILCHITLSKSLRCNLYAVTCAVPVLKITRTVSLPWQNIGRSRNLTFSLQHTVKPLLSDHCHERPSVLEDYNFPA